jgi:hypothetical protein
VKIAYRVSGVVVFEDPVGKPTDQVGVLFSVIKTNMIDHPISTTHSGDWGINKEARYMHYILSCARGWDRRSALHAFK